MNILSHMLWSFYVVWYGVRGDLVFVDIGGMSKHSLNNFSLSIENVIVLSNKFVV